MGDAVAAGDASLGPEVQAPAESPDAATEAEGGLGEDASEGAADAQGADTAGDAAGADPQQGCTYTPDPGAVTIQRLNRAEYDNTVLDLLLDASAPARDFPPDDHGYGFDHISDVLTVSPLLFEKHERAVGRLVETLLTREVKGTTVFEAEAEDLGGSVGAVAGLFWNLWANGTVTAEFEVAEGGIWLASARVSGQQAGPELVALELRVDDVALGAHHTASANGSIATYAAAVQLSPGPHTVQVAFLNDYWIEGVEDRNLLVDSLRIEGPFQPGAVSLHVEADSPPSADGMAVLASDAALEPIVRGSFQPAVSAASRAFCAAMRAESTRLIWPAPIPAVEPSFA